MEDTLSRNEEVRRTAQYIIKHCIDGTDQSARRAALAHLRASIGKPLSQSVEIWPLILGNVPEHFIGTRATITYELKAVIYAMQLYALFEQGADHSAQETNKCSETSQGDACQKKLYTSMGVTLRVLRVDEGSRPAMDRRFNVMITANDFESFIYYLRQLTRLLKGKTKLEKPSIDYGTLASDLYALQFLDSENVRLKWAQDYYSTK